MSRSHVSIGKDLRSAWLWYRERSLQASENFELDVRAAFVAIEEGPKRWPLSPLGVHRYKLKRFPYSVIYVEEPDGVLFLALAHGRRGPGFWLGRLSGRR